MVGRVLSDGRSGVAIVLEEAAIFKKKKVIYALVFVGRHPKNRTAEECPLLPFLPVMKPSLY